MGLQGTITAEPCQAAVHSSRQSSVFCCLQPALHLSAHSPEPPAAAGSSGSLPWLGREAGAAEARAGPGAAAPACPRAPAPPKCAQAPPGAQSHSWPGFCEKHSFETRYVLLP